jgi:hypothetical protein
LYAAARAFGVFLRNGVMLFMAFRCDKLKVLDPVIAFDVVNVVDVMAGWNWPIGFFPHRSVAI